MAPATVEPSEFHYSVVFVPAEEGGYLVTVPALPGLVTEGDTLEEAREMAGDAIRGYLEALTRSVQKTLGAAAAGGLDPPSPTPQR